jgi:hypothetical protein
MRDRMDPAHRDLMATFYPEREFTAFMDRMRQRARMTNHGGLLVSNRWVEPPAETYRKAYDQETDYWAARGREARTERKAS